MQAVRSQVWAIAVKSLKVKYKNSILGIAWSLVNPLLFLLIFNYIFGRAFSGIDNYALYALSGLVLWNVLPVASNGVIQSLVEGGGVLKSLAIKPLVFPMGAMVSATLHFMLLWIPFAILLFVLGFEPRVYTWMLIPLLVLYLLFIYGLSLLLGTFHLFFRDVGLLWNTLLPALFYFTPIAYPIALIPEDIRWMMELNPLYHFLEIFRTGIDGSSWPTYETWLICTGWTLASLAVGHLAYFKLKPGFIANY